MYNALRPFIGTICHVYLDDIIIWSQNLEEHRRNVTTILNALRKHSLFCSLKKTSLFCSSLNFLGHKISRAGIEPDGEKISKIVNWPTPRNATDVRAFLGLVRYVANFLPNLVSLTSPLNSVTTKEAEKDFIWTSVHDECFDAIKQLVTSHEVLTVINHKDMADNKIFVSTDASDLCTGAVLMYGPSIKTACPVAFESSQLKGAELNYPVHEKELLAIVRALKKWRINLLGVPFVVFTDHRTLENFQTQKHLSRHQARWQEFLGQYDYKIAYIKGEDNLAADALSRLSCDVLDPELLSPSTVAALHIVDGALAALTTAEHAHVTAPTVASTTAPTTRGSLRVASDPMWLSRIRAGYACDKWCLRLIGLVADGHPEPLGLLEKGELDGRESAGVCVTNRLLYIGNRLCIPRVPELREGIFRLAHDTLGHFSVDKSYTAIRDAYFWPKMRAKLEQLYILSCDSCQRMKASTRKPAGPLHPLPVPDGRGDSVAINFIGPLPEDSGFNCITTMTDRLGAELCFVPCLLDLSAEEFAVVFFEHWYCENRLPLNIISDRDKLFISRFWKALHALIGIKLKMSSSVTPGRRLGLPGDWVARGVWR